MNLNEMLSYSLNMTDDAYVYKHIQSITHLSCVYVCVFGLLFFDVDSIRFSLVFYAFGFVMRTHS